MTPFQTLNSRLVQRNLVTEGRHYRCDVIQSNGVYLLRVFTGVFPGLRKQKKKRKENTLPAGKGARWFALFIQNKSEQPAKFVAGSLEEAALDLLTLP